jgi:hypothetical protein
MKPLATVLLLSLCAAPSASAVDILPGDIITLPGSNTLEEADLVGAPVWGAVHDFVIHGAQQQLLFAGTVDLDVIHAALPDAMLFEFRIHTTQPELPGEVREVRWTGFTDATTNCNWRSGADLGDVAVMRAGRTWDGDTMTFGYNWWLHNPGEEVLSMWAGEDSSRHFILTNAPAFKADGSILTIELMSGESWSIHVPGPDWSEPADIDGDGVVNGADLGLMIAEWGTTKSFADLNGDGIVDGGDLGILLASWD